MAINVGLIFAAGCSAVIASICASVLFTNKNISRGLLAIAGINFMGVIICILLQIFQI